LTISLRRKFLAGAILTAWSVILTALTGILGGVPLRGLRTGLGASGYWGLTLAATAALLLAKWWWLALLYIALAVVIGLFCELEERGYSLVAGGLWSVVLTFLMLSGAFAFWVSHQGPGWYLGLAGRLENYLNSIPGWADKVGIEAKDLLLQVPSLIAVILILSLFFALLFQRRVAALSGHRAGPIHRLDRFRVPDAMIWVFIFSLAGTFLSSKGMMIYPIALNLLNVSAVALFLQGLAVISGFFTAFKVGWFWQMVLLVVLVTQLFVLVSLLGLVDYWANFRTRLAKRTEGIDREIYKK
jgi:hypothetical protein